MTESVLPNDAGTQKRRSTRIVQAVPLTVSGVDALGQPFKERTTTVMVNCHGCKYQSKHYVPKNSMVTLEIPRPEADVPPRKIQGRVVWVQRPRAVRELFQIGLEFEISGNVWGIAFPPEDWFPHPEDAVADSRAPYSPEFPLPIARVEGPSGQVNAPAAEAPEKKAAPPAAPAPPKSITPSAPAPVPKPVAVKPPAPTAPAGAPGTPATTGKIHVVPSPAAPAADSQTIANQMAKLVADAKDNLGKSLRSEAKSAITEEMSVVRQQLDAKLHDTVEKAIKLSMARVSESAAKKVIQDATDRTAAIIDEARAASEASAVQLDAKIRRAVEHAVNHAVEQAAQQAAEQTAAQNLKQAVAEAVERSLTEREASTPSLQILASPEAAQQHLDKWRKDLEDTAQNVRHQTVEHAASEAAAANKRWQEQFEASLANAQQGLDEKIGRASHQIIAHAEEELASRASTLRAKANETVTATQSAIESLSETVQRASERALAAAEQELASRGSALKARADETIATAQGALESLSASVDRERARAEGVKADLRDAAKTAVEKTRAQLGEIVASQHDEIARKTDRLISERVQQVEPLLESSAQKIFEQASFELEQNLSPKLEDVRAAVSELSLAEQKARHAQSTIREQMQQAAEQAGQLHSAIREDERRASERAEQLQDAVREQLQQASQQAIEQSLEKMREQTAKFPAQVEDSCRAAAAKVEEELQQKSTEAQHETYEALSKAADWYQKKAQTTMQSTLERAVEQSSAALRDRAAEISSLVASELDHYRRTYVEHSQAEIEEAAKETLVREREKLNETAEIAAAGFTDRVERVIGDSFRQFEENSRQALEKARSDMEYNREGSLLEFQKKLEERMLEGVEQAREQLQSQVLPLMQAWDAKREAEQRECLESMKKSAEESMEQYRGRLENASNSWLLASATTLGQHSQAVLDTLAKSAEKRIRETCADVLAGMGDTLKERLLGISGGFKPEDEDEQTPPPKK